MFPHSLVEKIILGENPIKVYRAYRKMTQQKLADEAGVTSDYISKLEKGDREGKLSLLKKIADILQVDLGLLV